MEEIPGQCCSAKTFVDDLFRDREHMKVEDYLAGRQTAEGSQHDQHRRQAAIMSD